MDYELTWDAWYGFYVRFAGWLTPAAAARLAHELTSDPRFDDSRYGIVDVLDCPGHRFRRSDAAQIALATGEILGALKSNPSIVQVAICTDQRLLNLVETYRKFTRLPVHVFQTRTEAHDWLAEQSQYLRHLAGTASSN